MRSNTKWMNTIGMLTVGLMLLALAGCKSDTSTSTASGAKGDATASVAPTDRATKPSNQTVGRGPYSHGYSVGSRGDKPGEFFQPVGLLVDADGNLYVSDAGNRRLQKVGPHGKPLDVWAEDIERPMHMGWSKAGELMTTVFIDDRIDIFDGAKKVRGFGGEWLDAPAAVAQAKDGRYYVADFYHHQFHIVSPKGTRVKTIGRKGEEDGQFTYPTDVAIGPKGNVWIADAYAHRLQEFTADGEHLKTIGGWGKKPGKFRVATGLDIGPDGKIYVADFKNNRVQILTADGTPVAVLGAHAKGDASMKMPTEVVATKDRVYVVDHGHHQIDVWSVHQE